MANFHFQRRTKDRPLGNTGITWRLNFSKSIIPSVSLKKGKTTFNTRRGFTRNLGHGASVRNVKPW